MVRKKINESIAGINNGVTEVMDPDPYNNNTLYNFIGTSPQ